MGFFAVAVVALLSHLPAAAAGGSSSSSSSSASSMASPAYTMDAAASTKCSEVMRKTYAQVTVSGAPVKSNFKNGDDQFGHANYQCLRKMIEKEKQYEKAISYAWCVYTHCETRCGANPSDASGEPCPVGSDDVQKCQSSVKNYLGFAYRKKTTPDLVKAREYYDQALEKWPENCGAMGYKAELEMQESKQEAAKTQLLSLCKTCGGDDQATKTTLAAYTAAYEDPMYPECSAAVGRAVSVALSVIVLIVSAYLV